MSPAGTWPSGLPNLVTLRSPRQSTGTSETLTASDSRLPLWSESQSTRAKFVSVPPHSKSAASRTKTSKLTAAPGTMSPKSQVITPPASLQRASLTDRKPSPAGSVSVTRTRKAVDGPGFLTVIL